MKIGIDCRLWSETGVGRYIRNLVGQLLEIDKNNEYVLFMLPKDVANGKWQMENGKWKIVPVDIRWHSVEEQVKLPKLLEKENLDLMHFPYFSVPVRYKKPYVMTIHDLILHHFDTGKASTLPLPLYKMKHVGYKYVLSQAAKNAQKIIVPLKSVKEDVLDTFKIAEKKIVVTPEGVDEKLKSKFKAQNSKLQLKSQKYYLYVGNAYPHKNLERLIEAFNKLIKSSSHQVIKSEDLKLVLVGKDDFFYKRLREKVGDMGLSESVIFMNHVPDDELAFLYAHAKALISPSLMEGFGLPPLEAMALSCPVVLTDIPAFREVCGNAAFYFNPYSVEAIREKMEYVYSITDKTRKEHIERGLERVKAFSWKKMAEQTVEVYESSNSL